ncbi:MULTISPECIES: ATP-binding protein [unclassified Polaromonas]|uniref:ATP-binding protein n=1 Tax=unclassified Polaromonas TaxID=2638319 RepID=UPI0018CB51C7|nr:MULTISPECIES: ATP-binding protein [unclassified Polaromonas]MBG6071180.1 signal transduction histidine kinase [Polaromonas sp. CG_9.7]MBG6113180.1 signal transduction histidine kinase [Polaromonas sp. CG_9.2]MDH6185712.1 signal transduction histidine kinase [Polaromonas sp. CG_23.6]
MALLLACLLAVLWSAVAWNHARSENRQIENSRQQTDTLALLFAQHTTATFRSVDHALLKLRKISTGHPAELQEDVKAYRDFLGEMILQIAIIDAQGWLSYSSLGMPKAPSFLGDREHFKVHLAGLQDKLFVSSPVKGRVSGKWSIQLSRPIFDKDRFVGVMVISVNPDYFVNFYEQARLGNYGVASMVRDSGEVMLRSSKQDQYVGKTINPSPYADPGAPLQGNFRRISQADGVERLLSYVRLPNYGLSVVIGPSVAEMLESVHQQQRQILLMASAVTLVTLLMGWSLLGTTRKKEEALQALFENQMRLRASHELLEKLSQHVPGMIYQYRLFADGHSAVPYASQGVLNTYGVTVTQVRENAKALLVNLHPEDQQAIDASIAESARTLQPWQHEFRLNHPHRGVRWLAGHAQPEKMDDGSTLWHGHISDITDIKNHEAVLLAANRELETFSYTVSHDLRSPLNTIDGFSRLLAKELTGSDNDKALYFLSRIQDGAAQMERLIADLLMLAQVANTQIRYEPVNLSALASSITKDLQARQPERKTTFNIESGLQTHGDAGLLRLVLENLMNNAWKYSSKLAEAQISIGQKLDAAGNTVFFVQDNGAGFDMAYAEKLFQPFQRLHEVVDFPGTGIGLATVNRIIVRHGGNIWAESAPDLGAIFFFSLPRVQAVVR